MWPSIPSGSSLTVRSVAAESIRAGDVLCYPGVDGGVWAHRVLRVLEPRAFLVRGDNSHAVELVSIGDWALKVVAVEWQGIRYSSTGPLGRLVAALAVNSPKLLLTLGRWLVSWRSR